MKKLSLQRTATFVSSGTAFLLVCIKLTIGILSGSIAVLSSAIDSLLDFFVSVFNSFAVYYAEIKPDKIFNYGRGKIEALAALFEGLIITTSGIYIFYESIRKLAVSEKIAYLWDSLLVMIVSIIITSLLVWFLHFVANKTKDMVIQSDSLHYKTDLYSNAGILIGLVIIQFTGFHQIDGIIGIIIAIYIIISAWDIIKQGFFSLLDISLSKEEAHKIKAIIRDTKDVRGFHKFASRQSGNTKFFEVDLEFDKNISLKKAHDISKEVQNKIKEIDTACERVFYIHMDLEKDEPES